MTNLNKDIVTISTNLDGLIDINNIKFSQILPCKFGESCNDLLFVQKKYGLYFYTSKSALQNTVARKINKIPTYVTTQISKRIFEIS